MVLVSRYVRCVGLAKLPRSSCQAARSLVPRDPLGLAPGSRRAPQLKQRDGSSSRSLSVAGFCPAELRQRFAFVSHS